MWLLSVLLPPLQHAEETELSPAILIFHVVILWSSLVSPYEKHLNLQQLFGLGSQTIAKI